MDMTMVEWKGVEDPLGTQWQSLWAMLSILSAVTCPGHNRLASNPSSEEAGNPAEAYLL